MSVSEAFDVAIAGGGIVGAACAYACARRGLKVALVERDVLGSGATAAGMGHVVVMDDSEAQFALTRYSQQLWQCMAPELPASAEYEQRGTLVDRRRWRRDGSGGTEVRVVLRAGECHADC